LLCLTPFFVRFAHLLLSKILGLPIQQTILVILIMQGLHLIITLAQ
jgi:hypothetical protein